MPLDFPPSSASPWTGSNGVVYVWNGTAWTVSGSSGGALPLSGGTMTGPIILAADPTTSPQAANKHYVDASINLAGNYLGTWSVAANTPNINAGGSISNANYVATTVNPATPETVPVGVPGIAGMSVANGDRIIWASGLGVWQILRNAGVTLAAADARYVALGGSTMTGALTLLGNAASALQAVPLQQLPVASSTTPVMDGTATIGSGTTWARADHIHPTDTTRAPLNSPTFTGTVTIPAGASISGYAPLAAPVFTGDARAVTATAGDNDTSIATTAFVQSALRYPNYVDNSGFQINQRAYVSGAASTAGTYMHDRWKAGAGGCTYTFAQSSGPSTTVTITAGTLQQVVEGAGLAAGTYMLSWTGTAQGRVGAGSYAASPVTAAGITAGANTTIEFNTGTLSQVKFEAGTVATPWTAPKMNDTLTSCMRFFWRGQVVAGGSATTGVAFIAPYSLPVPMRAATPTIAITDFSSCVNLSGVAINPVGAPASNRDLYCSGTVVATGAITLNLVFTVTAEL